MIFAIKTLNLSRFHNCREWIENKKMLCASLLTVISDCNHNDIWKNVSFDNYVKNTQTILYIFAVPPRTGRVDWNSNIVVSSCDFVCPAPHGAGGLKCAIAPLVEVVERVPPRTGWVDWNTRVCWRQSSGWLRLWRSSRSSLLVFVSLRNNSAVTHCVSSPRQFHWHGVFKRREEINGSADGAPANGGRSHTNGTDNQNWCWQRWRMR